jgi:hypothetical protein
MNRDGRRRLYMIPVFDYADTVSHLNETCNLHILHGIVTQSVFTLIRASATARVPEFAGSDIILHGARSIPFVCRLCYSHRYFLLSRGTQLLHANCNHIQQMQSTAKAMHERRFVGNIELASLTRFDDIWKILT